ncbi:hypothetical protein ACFL2L_01260 [Patescibacteria group bacterium]
MNILYKFLSKLYFNKDHQKSLDDLRNALKHGIGFNIKKIDDESGSYFYAEATGVPNKHIVTTGKTLAELDYNIKDAIFTAFKVPNYYCDDNLIKSPIPDKEIQLKYVTA